MDWTLEVVSVPVSDIDRSLALYRDLVGFELDHRTTSEHMDVAVQQLRARAEKPLIPRD